MNIEHATEQAIHTATGHIHVCRRHMPVSSAFKSKKLLSLALSLHFFAIIEEWKMEQWRSFLKIAIASPKH